MHALSRFTLVRMVIVIVLVLPAVAMILVVVINLFCVFVCARNYFKHFMFHWKLIPILSGSSFMSFIFEWGSMQTEVKKPARDCNYQSNWGSDPGSHPRCRVCAYCQSTLCPSSFYQVMFPNVSCSCHERNCDKFHFLPCIVFPLMFNMLIDWCPMVPFTPFSSKKKQKHFQELVISMLLEMLVLLWHLILDLLCLFDDR